MDAQSKQFTLKFGSEDNEINASTYGIILLNAVIIIEEASKELHTNLPLEIKVKSERKGSYLVDLSVQVITGLMILNTLLTKENLDHISNVIDLTVKALDLRSKLKGEKPKEIQEKGELSIIITGNNNKITVDKSVKRLVFDNKRGSDAIAATFASLAKDNKVDDFAILDEKDRPKLLIPKSDFPMLAKKIEGFQPEKHIFTDIAHLHIIRQSFEKDKKNDFLYRGFQITASISHEDFWIGVDNGEAFAKGDVLLSELQIEQVFNKTINAYENKGYTVTRVIEHIPRQTQPPLFSQEMLPNPDD